MEMDESEEHSVKAAVSICDSFEPLSNITVERFPQEWKHRSQRISTDEGMEMDESDEQPMKAPWSTRISLESLSNSTVEQNRFP
jgi:hypothetical protein